MVSVILSSWNSGKYLSCCQDSLFSQNFRDFEVILVDNGSADSFLVDIEGWWQVLDLKLFRV
jgi:glycosyltransferase involved in cell wall biosynthesis